jgi:hypothetical protein
MPKTFQDAVVVTRSIGLRYLWIDSLCIIQDDPDDWLRESANMGSIYKNSRLTIAASSATDSTQGLFLKQSELLSAIEPVEVPDGGGVTGGLVSSRIPRTTIANPDKSPLNKRAWATQEWILSRRMVHYMREGLIWSCRTLSQDETGEEVHIQARAMDWESIVEEYSKRQMTYRQDKLVALQGLANEMQKVRKDKYYLGLWTGGLPEQLLWTARSTLQMIDLPQLPSWSWASTEGEVHFWKRNGHRIYQGNPQKDCGQITIKEPGHLLIRGKLKAAGKFERIKNYTNTVSGYVGYQYRGPLYEMLAPSKESLGWCIFDRGKTPLSEVYCFPILKTYVGDFSDGVFYFYDVLLLQLSPTIKGAYVRIGAGAILTESW